MSGKARQDSARQAGKGGAVRARRGAAGKVGHGQVRLRQGRQGRRGKARQRLEGAAGEVRHGIGEVWSGEAWQAWRGWPGGAWQAG